MPDERLLDDEHMAELKAVMTNYMQHSRPVLAAWITALQADRAARTEQYDALLEALIALTPDGSEFDKSPDNCLRWIKDRIATTAHIAGERNRLRTVAEQMKTALETLKDRLEHAEQVWTRDYGMVYGISGDEELGIIEEALAAYRALDAARTDGEGVSDVHEC